MRKPGQVTYKDRVKNIRECNICSKKETEVEFYLRYRTICKKCHNKDVKARDEKKKKILKESRWF